MRCINPIVNLHIGDMVHLTHPLIKLELGAGDISTNKVEFSECEMNISTIDNFFRLVLVTSPLII